MAGAPHIQMLRKSWFREWMCPSECIHGNFTESWKPPTQLGGRHPGGDRPTPPCLMVSMNDMASGWGRR